MRKRFFSPALCALFFLTAGIIRAEERNGLGETAAEEIRWFRSNASGIALEIIPSRLAALRNDYCLSVEKATAAELPGLLSPYYDVSYSIELRTLYEKGGESRRQWIFRDGKGQARLAASGSAGFFGGESSGDEPGSGFIEIRNAEGSLVREFRIDADLSEWEFLFSYSGKVLLSVETRRRDTAAAEAGFVTLSVDYYRYSRSGSLRAIDRLLNEETRPRISFPPIGTAVPGAAEASAHGIAYTSEFLLDVYRPEGAAVNYTLDSRGRILGEVWKDADGAVLGEFLNTWSAERLESVLWKSRDEERLVEYEYDEGGNRVTERNFRQGVLERMVTGQDGRETEEIFMNGKLILRAFWENGVKISEERVFSSGTSSGGTDTSGERTR